MGNQNELNAAYAADGYGRIKDVPGCGKHVHNAFLKLYANNDYSCNNPWCWCDLDFRERRRRADDC